MIAADTSAWIDYSSGVKSRHSEKLEAVLNNGALVMPPPVLFEILSGPGLTNEAKELFVQLPRLDTIEGFWERAGELRRGLLKKGLKARSMDCLIAQYCMDNAAALIAADSDFDHFVKSGLVLAK
jgi:predicted nucleic acid-binding protein